ncbi:PAS domain-containing hybrid sensor histidine kinase/response regulator [Variovorax saccharolyticus]|uniref:PAS domain-containing hybrid sensor histidine kinase/response regulator n=1 Tax=Variovorax saccharolyticus TaxID=3053516 RepID=UPI002575DE3E|nr:ATP-binding protein [Variovorax sp. J22R187]MDM0020201.1 ATP-binding protein [Variovorax sp. J22R187]
MTHPAPDADLQDALSRLEASSQRQLELVRRVVALTAERDKLAARVRQQDEELGASHKVLVAAKRHLMVSEAARVAQWEWDMTGGKVLLGRRWDQMIGEVVEDRRWELGALEARVHPDDLPTVRQALKDALSGKSDRYIAEHRVSTAHGWIWIESIGMVTERDAEGKPLRLTGFNSDVTARRTMHAEIEQARAQAEASNRAKSEFLANMSHEVRTPLNAVMGLTRLLHQSPLNEEQRQHLELIDTAATSLLALLNDVLDLSKIEAGKLVFEQVRFDVGRWVREAVALHRPAAAKKGLKVEVEIADGVPWKVAGDPGRLRQVISNLVSNAVKFTDFGRISVTARMAPNQSELRRDQLRLLFTVRDTGIGVPEDKQAHIFEAFTQADASITRRYGGTGLGLAICARLVSMMGGALHLLSRPGEGSTFRFTAVFEQAADEMSVLTEPAPLEAVTLQGLHVLVAEDHAVNELLMRKLLTQMGCTFHVARNGEEALRCWTGERFDLVLMDVQMPVLSGLDAVARMRALEAAEPGRGHTPVVALTAHAMAGDRERCLAAGMDSYVSKPVSPALLAQAIQEARAARRAPDSGWEPAGPDDVDDLFGAVMESTPVDMRQLVRTLGGDLEMVREIAVAMRSDMEVRRLAIEKALAERDASAGKEQVHALKGALASICAQPAAQLAKKLESAWREGGDWETVQVAADLLAREVARVDAALAQVAEG